MGVRSRIIRSLYATGFGQGVTLLVQLAGVPLFLYFWGVDKYGEWLILSVVPAYLSMSDVGFGSVAANDMTMSVGQGLRDDAVKIFQSTLVVIFLAAAIAGLIVSGVILLQLGPGLLPVNLVSAHEVAIVLAVFWGQVVVGLVGGLVGAGYRCDGNFALGTFLGNVVRLAEFGALAACLLLGGGFVAAALSVLGVRFLGTMGVAAELRKRSPWLSFGLRRGSRSEIRRLLRPALAFMAFPLGNALSIQGFILVVAWVAGGAGVALFSTYRTMTRFPLQMMGMINSSVWPELSRSLGAGDIRQARRLHRLAVSGSVWLVVVAVAALAVLGETILRLWTGGRIPFEPGLFLILASVVLANSVWFTSSVVSVSVNRHEKIALAYLLGTAGALTLSVALGHLVGLRGVAAALLVVDVFMSRVVLPRSMELTQDTMYDFARWFAAAPRRSIAIALQRGR